MIRRKWLLALCILILAAACTEKSTPTGPVADTPENRKAAAKKYLEAMPPQELLKNISGNMLMRMPEATRKQFQAAMDDKDLVKKVYEISEKDLVKHFTPDELNAMTGFFGSPAGKSARAKFTPYMRELMPQVNKEVRGVFMKVQEENKKAQPPAGAPKAEKPKAEAGKPEQAKPAPALPQMPPTPAAKPQEPAKEQPEAAKPQAEQPKK